MPTSINSSGITFPDSTTQTTAVSGTGVPSTLTGVGSTVIAMASYGSAVVVGNTVSGAYLFYVSNTIYSGIYPGLNPGGNRVNATSSFSASGYSFINVGVGTWMNVGFSGYPAAQYDPCSAVTSFNAGIFRRIS